VNSFALVAYLPDPLGKFLDDLRRELVPGCAPRAHVTVLPPRPLSSAPQTAMETLRRLLPDCSPFQIGLAEIEVFPVTDVVYLGIGSGLQNLIEMHRMLNVGPLKYREPFSYHPHITLAQDLTHPQSVELAALTRRRWSEYRGSRAFSVESLVFVQNLGGNLWTDLERFQLDYCSSKSPI